MRRIPFPGMALVLVVVSTWLVGCSLLLPPTQQFFRFSLDEGELAAQGIGPEARTGMEEALSKVERLVLREIEASNDRVVLHEALLHLIVSGNCMLYIGEEGMRVFHLNRYVITRDPMGSPIEAIICEVLTYDTAPEKIRKTVDESRGELEGSAGSQPERSADDRSHGLQRDSALHPHQVGRRQDRSLAPGS